MKTLLLKFDEEWCDYEQTYISELMIIEKDARRYVVALKQSLEDEKAFIKAISDINPIANTRGHGRSDFEHKLLNFC